MGKSYNEMVKDVISYIKENHITSFSKLILYCENNNKAWFKMLMNKEICCFICEFLDSYSDDEFRNMNKQI